jgi:hypothetical protein
LSEPAPSPRPKSLNPLISALKKGWTLLLDRPIPMLFGPLLLVTSRALLLTLFPIPLLQDILTMGYPLLFLGYGALAYHWSAQAGLPWTKHVLLVRPPALLWRTLLYFLTFGAFALGLYFLSQLLLLGVGLLTLLAAPIRSLLEILSSVLPLIILAYIEMELTPMRSIQQLEGNFYLKSLSVREDFLQGRRLHSLILSLPLTILFWLAFVPDLVPGTYDLWLRILAWTAQGILITLPAAVHSSFYFQTMDEEGQPLPPAGRAPEKSWFGKHNPHWPRKG